MVALGRGGVSYEQGTPVQSAAMITNLRMLATPEGLLGLYVKHTYRLDIPQT